MASNALSYISSQTSCGKEDSSWLASGSRSMLIVGQVCSHSLCFEALDLFVSGETELRFR